MICLIQLLHFSKVHVIKFYTRPNWPICHFLYNTINDVCACTFIFIHKWITCMWLSISNCIWHYKNYRYILQFVLGNYGVLQILLWAPHRTYSILDWFRFDPLGQDSTSVHGQGYVVFYLIAWFQNGESSEFWNIL